MLQIYHMLLYNKKSHKSDSKDYGKTQSNERHKVKKQTDKSTNGFKATREFPFH